MKVFLKKYKYMRYKNIKMPYKHSMLLSSTTVYNASFILNFYFFCILTLKCIIEMKNKLMMSLLLG